MQVVQIRKVISVMEVKSLEKKNYQVREQR